jgi:hypothetical protein
MNRPIHTMDQLAMKRNEVLNTSYNVDEFEDARLSERNQAKR